MATVVAVYTGQGLAERMQTAFAKVMPDHRLVNLIDDGLIHDVIREGGVSRPIIRRLLGYYEQAAALGGDIILNTCSSVGEVVDLARPLFDIPIVRIDELMAQEAVRRFKRIGVLATLPTTLEPTVRLIRSQAAQFGQDAVVSEGLAAGAYQALIGGSPDEHDRLIAETALRLADSVDGLVLAQGSMARMEEKLAQVSGKPVLSSPELGLRAVRSLLERGSSHLAEEQGGL